MNKISVKGIAVVMMCIALLVGGSRSLPPALERVVFDGKYPVTRLEVWEHAAVESQRINSPRITTLAEFTKTYEPLHVRQTHQGHYAVLPLTDGRNAFVFFNQKGIMTRVMARTGFQTKDEFRQQIREHMPYSELLSVDPDTIPIPISAVAMTAHIVQEGVWLIRHYHMKDGRYYEESRIEKMEFFSNEELSGDEELLKGLAIPYILPCDKEGF